MKIKDFKHHPLHWEGNQCDISPRYTTHCILGDVYIEYFNGVYKTICCSNHKWGVELNKQPFRTLEMAKTQVKKMCDDYIQQSLGFLDNRVKMELK